MDIVQVVQVILVAGLSVMAVFLAVVRDHYTSILLQKYISKLLQLFVVQKAITKPFPVIKRRKEEKHFLDPIRILNVDFPSVEDAPTVDLSVIIPAYNEEQRCE